MVWSSNVPRYTIESNAPFVFPALIPEDQNPCPILSMSLGHSPDRVLRVVSPYKSSFTSTSFICIQLELENSQWVGSCEGTYRVPNMTSYCFYFVYKVIEKH